MGNYLYIYIFDYTAGYEGSFRIWNICSKFYIHAHLFSTIKTIFDLLSRLTGKLINLLNYILNIVIRFACVKNELNTRCYVKVTVIVFVNEISVKIKYNIYLNTSFYVAGPVYSRSIGIIM